MIETKINGDAIQTFKGVDAINRSEEVKERDEQLKLLFFEFLDFKSGRTDYAIARAVHRQFPHLSVSLVQTRARRLNWRDAWYIERGIVPVIEKQLSTAKWA